MDDNETFEALKPSAIVLTFCKPVVALDKIVTVIVLPSLSFGPISPISLESVPLVNTQSAGKVIFSVTFEAFLDPAFVTLAVIVTPTCPCVTDAGIVRNSANKNASSTVLIMKLTLRASGVAFGDAEIVTLWKNTPTVDGTVALTSISRTAPGTKVKFVSLKKVSLNDELNTKVKLKSPVFVTVIVPSVMF